MSDTIDSNLIQKSISMMLRSNFFMPFGVAILNYEIVLYKDMPLPTPACTDFDRIYINPDHVFFKEKTKNLSMLYVITFILLHEVSHVMFYHDKRKGAREHFIWNIATDFMINLLLANIVDEDKAADTGRTKPLMNMDLHKWLETDSDGCYSKDFEGLIEEEIYEELTKNGKCQKTEQKMSFSDFLKGLQEGNNPSDGDGGDDNSDNDGDKDGGEGNGPTIKVTTTQVEHNGKKFKNVEVEFPKCQNSKDMEDKQKKFQDDINMAKSGIIDSLKNIGDENSPFRAFLKKRFEVRVPWDSILKDSIVTIMVPSDDYTFSRPRISWLCDPHRLPYLPNTDHKEIRGTILFCVDESGSISDEIIQKAADVIRQSKEYYNKIIVMKHDVSVSWRGEYEEMSEEVLNEILIRRTCGGTSHKDLFEKCFEEIRKEEDGISLIISITDLYSDIQESQKILPSSQPVIYLHDNPTYDTRDINGKCIEVF